MLCQAEAGTLAGGPAPTVCGCLWSLSSPSLCLYHPGRCCLLLQLIIIACQHHQHRLNTHSSPSFVDCCVVPSLWLLRYCCSRLLLRLCRGRQELVIIACNCHRHLLIYFLPLFADCCFERQTELSLPPMALLLLLHCCRHHCHCGPCD